MTQLFRNSGSHSHFNSHLSSEMFRVSMDSKPFSVTGFGNFKLRKSSCIFSRGIGGLGSSISFLLFLVDDIVEFPCDLSSLPSSQNFLVDPSG